VATLPDPVHGPRHLQLFPERQSTVPGHAFTRPHSASTGRETRTLTATIPDTDPLFRAGDQLTLGCGLGLIDPDDTTPSSGEARPFELGFALGGVRVEDGQRVELARQVLGRVAIAGALEVGRRNLLQTEATGSPITQSAHWSAPSVLTR
jgi:hypothetical protein